MTRTKSPSFPSPQDICQTARDRSGSKGHLMTEGQRLWPFFRTEVEAVCMVGNVKNPLLRLWYEMAEVERTT